MEIGSFAVLVAFLCALFYTAFFHKPSRWALRFLRKSPHILLSFSNLCVCVCVFFSFIFMLISGSSLPTPRANLAPFGIDFGAIRGPIFPRFPPPALNSCRDFARNFARNLQRPCREITRNAKNMQRTSNKLMQRTFPKARSQAAYSILRRDNNHLVFQRFTWLRFTWLQRECDTMKYKLELDDMAPLRAGWEATNCI